MECNLNIILNKLVIFRMILSRAYIWIFCAITFFIMTGIHISNIKIGIDLKSKKKKKIIIEFEKFLWKANIELGIWIFEIKKKSRIDPEINISDKDLYFISNWVTACSWDFWFQKNVFHYHCKVSLWVCLYFSVKKKKKKLNFTIWFCRPFLKMTLYFSV